MPDTPSIPTPPPAAPAPAPQHHPKTVYLIAAFGIFVVLGAALWLSRSLMQRAAVSGNEHDPFLQMFDRVQEISSASYDGAATFAIEPRTPGARPFSYTEEEGQEYQAKLDRDVNRFRDLEEISRKTADPNIVMNDIIQRQGSSIVLPETIDRLGVNIKDPLTKAPYSYARAADAKSGTLAITFESGEAIDTVRRRIEQGERYAYPLVSREDEATIEGSTVTFKLGAWYSHYYSFSGKQSKPFLGELFGGESFFGFSGFSIPENLNVALRANGNTAKQSDVAPIDARFAIQADVTYAAFAFNLMGDLIKKDSATYVRTNTSPLGFFLNFAPIKDTWVKIVPEDLPRGGLPFVGFLGVPGGASFGEKKGMRLLEHLQLLLTAAKELNAFAESGAPEKETVDGFETYRYDVKLAQEQVVPFYATVTERAEAQFGSDALFKKDAGTLSYLSSRSFAVLFDYLKDQMSFTVWVDRASGYPVRFAYGLRYVPPDSARELADRELVVSLDVKLSDINDPERIEPPASSISFAEARDLLSGMSKEEGQFSRQISNVGVVRRALDDYFRIAGEHPKQLEDLVIAYKDLTAKYPARPSPSPTYGLPFDMENPFLDLSMGIAPSANPEGKILSAVPLDAYTGDPYEYRLDGARNYALRYRIRTPSFSGKTSYAFRAFQIELFVEGMNTANATEVSLEAKQAPRRDGDGDGVSDVLERYYGTDPAKRDTDGDGYEDKDEIDRGYDPRGPGKLERSEGFPFFGF